ncbi:hypothetical protein MPUL_13220 [Mycolicibacterium pulveris]|uniref:Uncharacterized protein n=1 Tax=Mycolicibacterium pulveris TaxID=36813 RepID=A0A7I7UFC9_MYCPV|nr:hypothetical protein MPUL_13220 [Mycolicibacterium pulveris]
MTFWTWGKVQATALSLIESQDSYWLAPNKIVGTLPPQSDEVIFYRWGLGQS